MKQIVNMLGQRELNKLQSACLWQGMHIGAMVVFILVWILIVVLIGHSVRGHISFGIGTLVQVLFIMYWRGRRYEIIMGVDKEKANK